MLATDLQSNLGYSQCNEEEKGTIARASLTSFIKIYDCKFTVVT
jgi:hypothetical protein